MKACGIDMAQRSAHFRCGSARSSHRLSATAGVLGWALRGATASRSFLPASPAISPAPPQLACQKKRRELFAALARLACLYTLGAVRMPRPTMDLAIQRMLKATDRIGLLESWRQWLARGTATTDAARAIVVDHEECLLQALHIACPRRVAVDPLCQRITVIRLELIPH